MLLENGSMSDQKLSKVLNWLELNFKCAGLISVDLERSEQISWFLENRKRDMFLVDLSVVGADYDEKSRYVGLVDLTCVNALVYDSVE